MIYDCFTFFNELELLEIRLHELDRWVDRFVLVESNETFSRKSKPLYFIENKHLFEPFLPKIINLVSPKAERPKDAWDVQKNQRDYVMHVLSGCSNDDLILCGDVDEIPRGINFNELQNKQSEKNKKWMVPFVQYNYFYYMNLRRPGGWPGTVMVTYKNLKSVFHSSLFEARMHRRHGNPYKSGGWHFSNLGGEDKVRLKMESSGHYDLKVIRTILSDKNALHDRMEVSRKVKGRKLLVEPIVNHPVWFMNNIEKFKHLITGEEGINGNAYKQGKKKGCLCR